MLSVGHNVGKRDSPVKSGARSFEKVDCDRIARGWLAGLRVTGEHRSSDTSAANQGAMAVLAGSKASA